MCLNTGMKTETTKEIKALLEAIDIAGGQTNLARLIATRLLPCSQSQIRNWIDRGNVPAAYCPAIFRKTGVLPARLNPSVDWDAIAQTADVK